MNALRFFSPLRAYRDLRRFLTLRRPHEFVFMAIALLLTATILIGFTVDSHVAVPYKRNIIYVEQWPADRTEAQILAQQKVDAVKKAKRDAEIKKLQDERRAEFKRLDDRLTAMGL